jgi:hypothetical protein
LWEQRSGQTCQHGRAVRAFFGVSGKTYLCACIAPAKHLHSALKRYSVEGNTLLAPTLSLLGHIDLWLCLGHCSCLCACDEAPLLNELYSALLRRTLPVDDRGIRICTSVHLCGTLGLTLPCPCHHAVRASTPISTRSSRKLRRKESRCAAREEDENARNLSVRTFPAYCLAHRSFRVSAHRAQSSAHTEVVVADEETHNSFIPVDRSVDAQNHKQVHVKRKPLGFQYWISEFAALQCKADVRSRVEPFLPKMYHYGADQRVVVLVLECCRATRLRRPPQRTGPPWRHGQCARM